VNSADVATMHWTFVGAGNMAASLVGGLLAGGADANDVLLVDPHAETRDAAAARFGVSAVARLEAAPSVSATRPRGVVIAVKPDAVESACRAISDAFAADASGTGAHDAVAPALPLVVSVAAGVRLEALASWLPTGTPICRCMPNTPSLLGVGATGLFANAACQANDTRRAEGLLGAAGFVVQVPDEALLDAVTATSGSGPAYMFLLVEHMAASGAQLGLDPDVARELAIETAFGAASMLRARDGDPGELRRRVTSKGGTTAAAIAAFEAAGLDAIVFDAMRAARDRAVELGDEFSPSSSNEQSPDR